jgi:hypothetical protein
MQAAKIRTLVEELDAHRKSRQQEHPDLTLTQMYNVLEKLKAMEAQDRRSSPPGLVPGVHAFNRFHAARRRWPGQARP